MSILDTVPDCIFCYLTGRIYNRYEAIWWLSKSKKSVDENIVDTRGLRDRFVIASGAFTESQIKYIKELN